MKPLFCKSDKYQKKQNPIVNDQKKDLISIKEHFKNIDNIDQSIYSSAEIKTKTI